MNRTAPLEAAASKARAESVSSNRDVCRHAKFFVKTSNEYGFFGRALRALCSIDALARCSAFRSMRGYSCAPYRQRTDRVCEGSSCRRRLSRSERSGSQLRPRALPIASDCSAQRTDTIRASPPLLSAARLGPRRRVPRPFVVRALKKKSKARCAFIPSSRFKLSKTQA